MCRFIAFIAALLLVLSTPRPLLAQDASPVAAEGMPGGVAFDVLAQGVVDQLPPGPAEIGLARHPLPQYLRQTGCPQPDAGGCPGTSVGDVARRLSRWLPEATSGNAHDRVPQWASCLFAAH